MTYFIRIFLFLSFFISMKNLKAQLPREVIGYYPSWQWYDRNQLVNPETIAYSKYSIINYAFFQPNKDGTLSGLDSWADEVLLQGKINYQTEPISHYPNTSLVDLAHQSGTKVLISIGGWSKSDLFSDITQDSLKRVTFALECRRLVEIYKLDGIDIDWEYPGVVERFGKPYDKQNFTLLLRGVKEQLDSLSAKTGQTYLLTAAFGAFESAIQNIEWADIHPLLTSINMMTYDFHGAWDKQAGHNSPLFAAVGDSSQSHIDGTIQLLTSKYGVPAEKINMGLAFYGRSVKTEGNSIFSSVLTGKVDTILFKDDDGSPTFYNILNKKEHFNEHWDDAAKVPYLTGKDSLNTFLSYDNERSIALKAQYIVDKKLKGAILWDLTGDYIQNADSTISTPLLDSLITAIKTAVIPKMVIDNVENAAEIVLDTIQNVVSVVDIEPVATISPMDIPVPEIVENEVQKVENEMPQSPNDEKLAILENFDLQMSENDFLILKFTMKQGGNVCLRVLSEDKEISRDLDLGIVGEGYTERFSTIHRPLKSGKYKIWIEACSAEMSSNPTVFKEWIKE
jgi:GH18 family chitinase